jgi:hypothetical protein
MEDNVTKILANGPKTNRELREELKLVKTQGDPQLDRALQKLRKDGKILVVQGRWALSTVVMCPGCDGRGWIDGKKPKKSSKSK